MGDNSHLKYHSHAPPPPPRLAPVRYYGYSDTQIITTNDIQVRLCLSSIELVTDSREQSVLQEQCDSSRRLESLHQRTQEIVVLSE